ncbi:SPFH domain-containing protein [Candidatus Uhrbacteria bacterium]|nr:SPFH domain-containing protein [Candidatus Uhrbacteria bacterium]
MDHSSFGERAADAAGQGPPWVQIVVLVVLGIVGLILLFGTFFTVEQQRAAVLERFGKFLRIAGPGLNVKVPLIDSVVHRVNLRTKQLEVKLEAKTRDNVMVRIVIAVQYAVMKDKVYDAHYKLADATAQITSFVQDVVRAQIPVLTLDAVFETKDQVAQAVKQQLSSAMDDFGFSISNALVTDIDPDEKVKAAMNEINAAQRQRVAAQEKGEADKILAVKQAEAESESKRLQGEGIANQRKAIARGIEESLETLKRAGVNPHEATVMMLMTQYLDTLHAIGAKASTSTILLPHSPGAIGDLMQQVTQAIAVGNAATPPLPNPPPSDGAGKGAAAVS